MASKIKEVRIILPIYLLRQVDVKAEHFERQVQRMEQERDAWEKKYEESEARYQASKKELDELVLQMEGL
ncbi:hypothetical protein BT96DRAFT_993558 [Gymnopus androsaceus JB14]|uniref:Uncharacterized protein n=1 Tax=Gymnopus androsaceus JB14 TaxID=1447944 RepID=A0A6A4HP99_9AGAR|nr:hypothetical protein BT96DRAFT_993558 [Gymnopus androsaceus JB14]